MPRLLRKIARTGAVAGAATAVGRRVRQRQDQKQAGQGEPAAEAQPGYEDQRDSAPPAKDRLQQLKELGDLKAQGVLTEEEFGAEKAKILAA
jgi:hypothetical protein